MRRLFLLLLAPALFAVFPSHGFAQAVDPATAAVDPGTAEEPVKKPTRPRRANWLSDRQSFRVGDIITVHISEYARASDRSRKAGRSSRAWGTDMDVDLPMEESPLPITQAGASSSVRRDERQATEVDRQNQLVSEMSVQVMEITEAGLLRVEGKREVTVDKHKKVMTLSGYLRPEDVTMTGIASSARLAQAKISYSGKGPLIKAGFIGRILGWFWP